MDTTEASQLFGLEAKHISKLCKEGLIPEAKKQSQRWIIPDDLKLIMSKNECSLVLLEILKRKNYGNTYPINRKLFPDDEKLLIVIDYLYRIGLVGEYNPGKKIEIENVQLTEEGFKIALGEKVTKINISLHFSMVNSIQVGMVNL